MFFGEKRAKGILTGKSLTGYTVGEDAFDRPGKPMVRIWLDHLPEEGSPGEDKLTLEVDKDLYERLEVNRRGTVVWRGKKLLRFEPEEGPTAAPEKGQAAPGPGGPRRGRRGDSGSGRPGGAGGVPGRSAGRARLRPAGHGLPLVRPGHDAVAPGRVPGIAGPAAGQAQRRPRSPMEESDFIPLSGGFFDSGHVLVRVCQHCRRAVIDYGSGQCDYNTQVRKEFLFP